MANRTFIVRHDSGEHFEVTGRTMACIRVQIEVECWDRGWLMTEVVWSEKGEKQK